MTERNIPFIMTRTCFCAILLALYVPLFGQKNLAGIYSTNFPTYGMFGKIITLNCDSSTTLNFRGDLMNDTSHGVWTLKRIILTINFDTLAYPSQRYRTPLNFRIKRNRLYLISLVLSKTEYDKLKLDAEKSAIESNENIKIPSYSKLQRMTNKTPKDFKGKDGKQYFKIVKRFTCDNNKNR